MGRRRPWRMYMRDFPRLEPPGRSPGEEGEVNDSSTPRPNVATGAFMGFATMVLDLLLTALQTNPSSLEGWLVALQPEVGFAIVYFAPAFQIPPRRLRSRRRDGRQTRRARESLSPHRE
jgi:hypothetical protein